MDKGSDNDNVAYKATKLQKQFSLLEKNNKKDLSDYNNEVDRIFKRTVSCGYDDFSSVSLEELKKDIYSFGKNVQECMAETSKINRETKSFHGKTDKTNEEAVNRRLSSPLTESEGSTSKEGHKTFSKQSTSRFTTSIVQESELKSIQTAYRKIDEPL